MNEEVGVGASINTGAQKDERPKANIFNVVESVVLAMSVGLMLWVANLVVKHGEILSAHTTSLQVDDDRLDSLESRGSPTLAAHVTENISDLNAMRQRLDKLDTALLALQATPGKLETISVRLEGLREGQLRLEKTLEAVIHKP